MKTTQEKWVIEQLTKHGKVTRNQALRRFISRLGARIADLRAAGWKIHGYYKKTKMGKDYVYEVEK